MDLLPDMGTHAHSFKRLDKTFFRQRYVQGKGMNPLSIHGKGSTQIKKTKTTPVYKSQHLRNLKCR